MAFILLICIIVFWVTMLKNKFHQCVGGMLIMFFISLHGSSSQLCHTEQQSFAKTRKMI